MIKLVICGDLCPTNQNMSKFEAGRVKEIFSDTASIINGADIAIANLECPLTDNTKKMFKSGPNNKGSKKAINGIVNANFDVMSLANNHIKDFGSEGLLDTIECCEKNGIKVVGAGKSIYEASKPIIIEKRGIKVGFISFSDNEGNLATMNDAGANGLDEMISFDDISGLKSECDKVIVLYHSGIEHYPYPSPRLKSVCRKMVDAGADIVSCQHSHCIGAKEEYKSSIIVYGQGNFLFSKENKKEDDKWNFGLILNILLDKNEIRCDYIPTIIKDGFVGLAKGTMKQDILTGFYNRSEQSNNDEFLVTQFEKESSIAYSKYFGILLGLPRWLYIVNKLLRNRVVRALIPNKKAIVMLNVIRCESHREMLISVISKYIKSSSKR